MSYHPLEMNESLSSQHQTQFTIIPSEAPARRIVGGRNLAVPRGPHSLKILAFLSAIVALCLPLSASAQGCALCYTTVSAAGSAAIRALHLGILAVLVPALVLFLSILFMLFRRAAAEPA
jgi:hypothetical protein